MASKKADRFGFYLRGRTWYTSHPLTGRDVSTRCRDLEAARAWRAARERLAADPAAQAAKAATLGDECRMMVEALKALGRPTTYYEAKLGHWTRVLGNNCALADVGPEAFDRFVATRRADGVTNHTISKEIKCMVTTLRQAKRAGRWSGDLSTLRPLGFSAGYVPRTRVLTLTELGALLSELRPSAQAFVALSVALGLRRGEVLALRREDVDVEAWVVHVRGTKTKGALRDLPVLEPFRPLVASAAAHLPLDNWARTHTYTVRFEAACERAGIPKVTPNDLRRTHATLLRNSGVDASTARALLGHTKGSQLLEQTYDKPKPAELAARAGDLSALAAELGPIAESLQSTPAIRDFDGQKAASEWPWGPVYYPAAEERQALSATAGRESELDGVRADADSLQVAALRLALAARAALHGGRVPVGEPVPVTTARRRPARKGKASA
jgi:integrase